MKVLALVLVAGGLLMLGAGESCAQEDDLVVLVRQLTAIQSRVVSGDVDARGEAQAQLKKIDSHIANLDPEALQADGARREIALYLLAGGSSTVVRKLFADGVFDQTKAPLVAAALAYAEGRRKEAIKKFDEINEQEYSHRLGGHIALVKGGLLLGADKQRATASLDWARLMLPGSLVEEAALRRLVVALDMVEDERRYLMLIRRYAEKYRNSPFAESFRKFVMKRALENAMKLDDAGIDGFAAAIALESKKDALEWRLYVLRQALLDGRVDMAASQYVKAEKLAGSGAQSGRMSLYNATLLAMQGKVDDSERELAKVNMAALSSDEQVLIKVVDAVLQRVKPSRSDDQPVVDGAQNEKSPAPAPSPVMLSAQRSLDAADEILRRRAR